jgi:flagellar hook-basal body complex protein FliE
MPILPIGAVSGASAFPNLPQAVGGAGAVTTTSTGPGTVTTSSTTGPLGAASSTTATTGVTGLTGPTGPTGPTAPTDPSRVGAPGGGFEATLAGAINNLQGLQTTSDVANIQAVTSGNLDDIHNATIAAARVQTAVQLVAAVRNQAVDAFNEIMRMGS